VLTVVVVVLGIAPKAEGDEDKDDGEEDRDEDVEDEEGASANRGPV
jgi:hypothetical protein